MSAEHTSLPTSPSSQDEPADAQAVAVAEVRHDGRGEGWKAFRLAFNDVAMAHGGIPHVNKTRDGAIGHFVKAHDRDAITAYLAKRREFDPKDLFLNDFFQVLFRPAL
jgi:hypothetical protein